MAMEATTGSEELHPLGEGDFGFLTPGGRVRLSMTDDALTPFVNARQPWTHFRPSRIYPPPGELLAG